MTFFQDSTTYYNVLYEPGILELELATLKREIDSSKEPWKQKCAGAVECEKSSDKNKFSQEFLIKQLPKLMEDPDFPQELRERFQKIVGIIEKSKETIKRIKTEGAKASERLKEIVRRNDEANKEFEYWGLNYTFSTFMTRFMELSGEKKLFPNYKAQEFDSAFLARFIELLKSEEITEESPELNLIRYLHLSEEEKTWAAELYENQPEKLLKELNGLREQLGPLLLEKAPALNLFRCLNLPEAMKELIDKLNGESQGQPLEKMRKMAELLRLSYYLYYHACCKPREDSTGSSIWLHDQALTLHFNHTKTDWGGRLSFLLRLTTFEREDHSFFSNHTIKVGQDPIHAYFPDYKGNGQPLSSATSRQADTGIKKAFPDGVGTKLNSTKSLAVVRQEFNDAYEEMVQAGQEEKAKFIIAEVLKREPLFNQVYVSRKELISDLEPLHKFSTEIMLNHAWLARGIFLLTPIVKGHSYEKYDEESYSRNLRSTQRLSEILEGTAAYIYPDQDTRIEEEAEANRSVGTNKSIESLLGYDKETFTISNVTAGREEGSSYYIIDLLSCPTSKVTLNYKEVVVESKAEDAEFPLPEEGEIINVKHTSSMNSIAEHVKSIKILTGGSLKISPEDFAISFIRMMIEKHKSPGNSKDSGFVKEFENIQAELGLEDIDEAYLYLYLLSLDSKNYDPELIALNLEKFKAKLGYSAIEEMIKFLSPLAKELSIEFANKEEDDVDKTSNRSNKNVASITDISDIDDDITITPQKESLETKILSPQMQIKLAEEKDKLIRALIELRGLEMIRDNANHSAREANIEQVLKDKLKEKGFELLEEEIRSLGKRYLKECKYVESKFKSKAIDSCIIVRLLKNYLFDEILRELKCLNKEEARNNFTFNLDKLGIAEIRELAKALRENIDNPSVVEIMRFLLAGVSENCPAFFAFGNEDEKAFIEKHEELFKRKDLITYTEEPKTTKLSEADSGIVTNIIKDAIIQTQLGKVNWRSLRPLEGELSSTVKAIINEEKPENMREKTPLQHRLKREYTKRRAQVTPKISNLSKESAEELNRIDAKSQAEYNKYTKDIESCKDPKRKSELIDQRDQSAKQSANEREEALNKYEKEEEKLLAERQEGTAYEIIRAAAGSGVIPKVALDKRMDKVTRDAEDVGDVLLQVENNKKQRLAIAYPTEARIKKRVQFNPSKRIKILDEHGAFEIVGSIEEKNSSIEDKETSEVRSSKETARDDRSQKNKNPQGVIKKPGIFKGGTTLFKDDSGVVQAVNKEGEVFYPKGSDKLSGPTSLLKINYGTSRSEGDNTAAVEVEQKDQSLIDYSGDAPVKRSTRSEDQLDSLEYPLKSTKKSKGEDGGPHSPDSITFSPENLGSAPTFITPPSDISCNTEYNATITLEQDLNEKRSSIETPSPRNLDTQPKISISCVKSKQK